MKKQVKKTFSLVTLLFGVMLVFAMIGCGNAESGPVGNIHGNYSYESDSGTGWPTDKMVNYGLSGWTEPNGLGGEIEWEEGISAYTSVLTITFTSATDNTAGSFNLNLTQKGYSGVFYEENGDFGGAYSKNSGSVPKYEAKFSYKSFDENGLIMITRSSFEY